MLIDKMDYINRLNSPMGLYKEDLTAPPIEQERRRETTRKEVLESPVLFRIGSVETINKRIAYLDHGLKTCHSDVLVIESQDASRGSSALSCDTSDCKLRSARREPVQNVCNKGQDRHAPQKPTQTNHLAVTSPDRDLYRQSTEIKFQTKPRLVELHQFPGLLDGHPMPLPHGIRLCSVINNVVLAHKNTGSKVCSPMSVRQMLSTSIAQDIVLCCYWWIFLHRYKPDTVYQRQLFDCLAEKYIQLLYLCRGSLSGENVLKILPLILSQAVYSSFCLSFPESLHQFQTDDFKLQLCNHLWQWIGGICPPPGNYNTWDYSSLEPNNLNPAGKIQRNQPRALEHEGGRNPETWSIKRSLSQKVLMARESHPACPGPQFTRRLFSLSGNSPLVQYYLQKQRAAPQSGVNILVPRTEIEKPIPSSSPTYADLVKQGYAHLHEKRARVQNYFRKQRKETLDFNRSLWEAQREFARKETILLQKPEVRN